MTRILNQPLGGNDMPRFAGIATMMRLPHQKDAKGLDACFVGVPMDIGASYRSGTRLGPRQIRAESVMLRPYNMATRAAPFDSLQVADIGDVPINTFDLKKTVDIVTAHFDAILGENCIPLTLGGDHTLTLPILRRYGKKTWLRRLDPCRCPCGYQRAYVRRGHRPWHTLPPCGGGRPARLQAGRTDRPARHRLRGGRLRLAARAGLPRGAGRGMLAQIADPADGGGAQPMGDGPVYLTYDIDSLDPGFVPGTGTLEIGGLTPWQALEIIRAVAASTLSAATSSRCHRRSIRSGRRRISRPICFMKCSACCPASPTAPDKQEGLHGPCFGRFRRNNCADTGERLMKTGILDRRLFSGIAISTLLLGTVPALAADELNALVWCDHTDPALIEPFEKANNVKVNLKTYEGTGAGLAIIEQSQPGDWDVLVVDGIDVPRVREKGILAGWTLPHCPSPISGREFAWPGSRRRMARFSR